MSDVAFQPRHNLTWRNLLSHRDPRASLTAILFALCLLATIIVGRFAFTTWDMLNGGLDSETDPRPVVLSVGPKAISVPRNMIRNYPFARGSVSELELRMHWPTMEGYSELRAEAFRANDDRSPIIYATLRPAAGDLAPEERVRLVYSRLVAEDSAPGPSGLIATPFARGHGYDGETLFTSPQGAEPFVARCAAEDGGVPATCIVEFRTSAGIDVIYRFRRHLLSRWQAVDAAMRGTVASFARD